MNARPVVPSAIHPSSVHPEGKGDLTETKFGVGGFGSQVGLGPVPTQRGLHPGRSVRVDVKPTFSLGMVISGLQARAAALLINGLSGAQSVGFYLFLFISFSFEKKEKEKGFGSADKTDVPAIFPSRPAQLSTADWSKDLSSHPSWKSACNPSPVSSPKEKTQLPGA